MVDLVTCSDEFGSMMIIVEYNAHCYTIFCRLPDLYSSQIVQCQIFGHPFA